jgi:hypothetical protein
LQRRRRRFDYALDGSRNPGDGPFEHRSVPPGATNGGADMTPVYNLGGTVDSSATSGPVAGALGATAPQAKQRRPQ